MSQLLGAAITGVLTKEARFTASTHPEQWEVFSSMDADGNGTLDTDELFIALADKIEESVAYELMEIMDMNGDGVIDFEEFCTGWDAFQSKM